MPIERIEKTIEEVVDGMTGLFNRISGEFWSKKALSVILVQDSEFVQNDTKDLARKIKSKGYGKLDVKIFEEGYNLEDHLASYGNDKDKNKIPTKFLLDCSGYGGNLLGAEVVKWFEKHRPEDKKVLEINFISLDTTMAAREAAKLKTNYSDVKIGFTSTEELRSLLYYLNKDEKVVSTLRNSGTNTLRVMLNTGLDTNFSEEVNMTSQKSLQDMYNRALRGSLFDVWKKGKITSSEVIDQMRSYAVTLANSLQSGLYGAKNHGIEADTGFYEGTGFPVKGEAVFTIEDVQNWPNNRDDKPILVMQSYDPSIAPLLEDKKLGGVIVCGMYLASHLTFLCEESKVSGAFGMISKNDKGAANDFNQMSQSNLEPFFKEEYTEINGTMIQAGQTIIIGVGDNGKSIAFKPETIKNIEEAASKDKGHDFDITTVIPSDLKSLYKCFENFFVEKGAQPHKVKMNTNSATGSFLRLASGIGLIRTEQVAAMDKEQANALRDVLLSGEEEAHKKLKLQMGRSYRTFIRNTDEAEYQVKFRLFDLSPKELFDAQGQKEFHELYKSLDIHGGKALETWPQLYKDQVDAIFEVYNNGCCRSYNKEPIQVMMPAIRTEVETLKIKKIIQKSAEKQQIKEDEYKFGVMIETLDSCKNAEDIIKHCDFISFGTNDLTQQVLNIPRDNLRMRAKYEKDNGFDPYQKLAPEVMKKIKDVCAVARRVNPKIEIDICGGQAADMNTALKLFDVGVDNLSVAPVQKNLLALPILLNYHLFDQVNSRDLKNINSQKLGVKNVQSRR